LASHPVTSQVIAPNQMSVPDPTPNPTQVYKPTPNPATIIPTMILMSNLILQQITSFSIYTYTHRESLTASGAEKHRSGYSLATEQGDA